MPQMAPLSWLNLFMFFIMIFVLLNTMNYFSLMYKNKYFNIKKIKKMILWKW
nr:ATP synthase F0 subunit 8 [Pygoluciola sp.]